MHITERSQSEKDTYCMIPAMCHFGKGKNFEGKNNDQWLLGLGEAERDE